MVLTDNLAGGHINIGDGGPNYLNFAMTNRANLPSNHPLKADGLQTLGWTIRVDFKKLKESSDVLLTKISQPNGGVRATSKDAGVVDLFPADTLIFEQGNFNQLGIREIHYKAIIRKNDGSAQYTLEEGAFTVSY